MVVNNSIPNFLCNCLVLIDIKTNIVVDFDSENSTSNKKIYLSNDYIFLFNNNYYKDNLSINSNYKSAINLIILIKKRTQQE